MYFVMERKRTEYYMYNEHLQVMHFLLLQLCGLLLVVLFLMVVISSVLVHVRTKSWKLSGHLIIQDLLWNRFSLLDVFFGLKSTHISSCFTQVQTEADEKDYKLVKEIDTEKLLAFLQSVEPMVSKALNRNIQSTAFEGRCTKIIEELKIRSKKIKCHSFIT